MSTSPRGRERFNFVGEYLSRQVNQEEGEVVGKNGSSTPGGPGLSRRQFLGSAAALGGAAWATSILGPNVAKALAQPPPNNGRLQDIEHVVILMQENRSFDHYY